MGHEYLYNNIYNEPKLSIADENGVLCEGIHYDVATSDMDNKSLEWCRWDDVNGHILVCYFTQELSSADKIKLDTIVENNS